MNTLEQLVKDVQETPACDKCRSVGTGTKMERWTTGEVALQHASDCRDCLVLILTPVFNQLGKLALESKTWEKRAEEALTLVEKQNAILAELGHSE